MNDNVPSTPSRPAPEGVRYCAVIGIVSGDRVVITDPTWAAAPIAPDAGPAFPNDPREP